MDKEGVKYFGIKAEDLLSSLNRIDIDKLSTVLMNIVGNNLTFLIKLTSYTLNRGRSEHTISQILGGASNPEEKFDKKDDFSGAHSSSQSLSSCVVQNEILIEATLTASYSAKCFVRRSLRLLMIVFLSSLVMNPQSKRCS
ncbi:hypothetical protein LINPERHAP1_LOCUS16154 [Linum perenne]